MEKLLKICPVCGKEFEPINAAAKYCSTECSIKGKYQRRKEWEERSGYREQQRLKMKEYRAQISEAERLEREEAQARVAAERERQITERQSKARDVLITAAEQGDPIARMKLAIEQGGNTSPEYWDAYKDYELQRTEGRGKKSITTVNGISVQSPYFGLAVSMSIEDNYPVSIYAGVEKDNGHACT